MNQRNLKATNNKNKCCPESLIKQFVYGPLKPQNSKKNNNKFCIKVPNKRVCI